MKKNYSNSFKSKVVLEVLRGDLTIAEIISKFQVSKSVIHKWKKQFLDNASSVFNAPHGKTIQDVEIAKLHAKIGQLTIEKDFLQDAWEKVQIRTKKS